MTSSSKFSFWLEWRMILTGAAIFSAGLLTRGFFNRENGSKIIYSPRSQLLPRLSDEEKANLPYPPDALPGARDVASPYGTLRIYEWGPEHGRKVLFVHGISTPCLTLAAVAHGLVDNGCRVMLFDLFGRGYSDTPSDLQHDDRLFSTQILLALTSSPLSWTGSSSGGGFAMIGYSLGGGISVAFTSYFPNLVNSLILIAPSGLIRPYHFGRVSRIIYSKGVIPEPVLNRLVRRRLQTPLYPTKKKEMDPAESGVLAPVKAEVNIYSNAPVILSKSHPNITIEAAVIHQVINHEGFVPAFMSSIRNAPISEQHEYWRRIGRRLTIQNQNGDKGGSDESLENGKVLIIGGTYDALIKKDELEADAMMVLEGNVVFKFIATGHEAPVTNSSEVTKLITDFW